MNSNDELFNINKKAVFECMESTRRRIGVTRLIAICVYSGCGDEGGVEGCSAEAWIEDERIEVALTKFPAVNETVAENRFDGDKWVDLLRTEHLVKFEVALGNLTDAAIDASGHRGYENNEGGCGELTLCVSEAGEPTARLDHRDYFVEQTVSEHSL